MRLRVIGSSGTFPVPGRPASGYLIEQGSTRVWCDAGPGTYMALPVEPDLVDAIVVSHQHPDHCSDIFTAFHAWTYRPRPRTGVPLYAPQEVWDHIVGFLDHTPDSVIYETFDFNPVSQGDRVTIGDLEVRFSEMDHSVPTVGSQWTADNRTLFFTADTGPGGEWRSFAEGADLLLSEASFQGASEDKPFAHHLAAAEAGSIAREVGARRLVLTHIPPYLDPARSIHEAETAFDRPVTLATPATSIDV